MLGDLTSAGLTGLTLWPEDLRHPFSFNPDKLLLSPKDFAGLNIRTPASNISDLLIKSLGGNPGIGDNEEGAESGLRQGASLDGNPVATGNVTFFAKYQVLFANDASVQKLSEEQRAILREAANATQQKAIAEYPSEAEAGKAWCAVGKAIVFASTEQIDALKTAAQPVFDEIEKNPLNMELIASIRELKSKTTPTPGAEACNP